MSLLVRNLPQLRTALVPVNRKLELQPQQKRDFSLAMFLSGASLMVMGRLLHANDQDDSLGLVGAFTIGFSLFV